MSLSTQLKQLRSIVFPKRASEQIRFKRQRQFAKWIALPAVILLALFSYFTNPFVRFSLVVDPYPQVTMEGDQFVLNNTTDIVLKDNVVVDKLVFLKSGWYIFSGKFVGGPKAPRTTVDAIINDIHELRFNPEKPFLISGDHFSVLYPRSLGIFYHSLLDPRTAMSPTNWRNRQLIYLKTTAYALHAFSQSEQLSTTIVPVGPRSVSLMNIYALPSDTLYSLLYALDVMQSEESLRTIYPFGNETDVTESLATRLAAEQLVAQYQESLRGHYQRFMDAVYDQKTGLVKTDIYLAGVKDMAKRKGAFYDNVMVWKTTQLAQKLGLIDQDQAFLDDYKQRILATYWVEGEDEQGYFKEDLSDAKGVELYSSDWIVAYQVGLLRPENLDDLPYLEKSVAYIQRNAIDQPFGLQYHPDPRRQQLYWPVRLSAPDYGSTAIWSNWGMEYTKLLAHLGQVTGWTSYMTNADQQISAYTYNIKRYRGYPEVYDSNGDFFSQRFYKSVRQTGWVVSYQQAREMVEWTNNNWSQFSRGDTTRGAIFPVPVTAEQSREAIKKAAPATDSSNPR